MTAVLTSRVRIMSPKARSCARLFVSSATSAGLQRPLGTSQRSASKRPPLTRWAAIVMCKLHNPDATYSDHLSVYAPATPLLKFQNVGTTPTCFSDLPLKRLAFWTCTVALKCLASQRRRNGACQRAFVKATVDPNIRDAVTEGFRCDASIEI
jgi:hypothetical protein